MRTAERSPTPAEAEPDRDRAARLRDHLARGERPVEGVHDRVGMCDRGRPSGVILSGNREAVRTDR